MPRHVTDEPTKLGNARAPRRDGRSGIGVLQPLLSQVRTPTLVIWGDTDRVLDPSAAQVFGDGIPGSTVVMMEQMGHAPMIERPEETAALLRAHWSAARR